VSTTPQGASLRAARAEAKAAQRLGYLLKHALDGVIGSLRPED
jgi:hypothetical protein